MKSLAIGLAVGASFFAFGRVSAQNLLLNPELEVQEDIGRDSKPLNWTVEEGPPVNAGFPPPNDDWILSMAESSYFFQLPREGEEVDPLPWLWWFQPYWSTLANQGLVNGGFAHLTQYVAATPGVQYTMSGWSLFEEHYAGGVSNLNNDDDDEDFTDGPLSPTRSYFAMEFLSWENAVLPGSLEIDLSDDGQMNDAIWRQHTLTAVAPPDTWIVRVRASMVGGVLNPGADPQSFMVDGFSLTATAPTFLDGDFDENGFVDGGDVLLWQEQLGSSVPADTGADGDGSSNVTANDLTAWVGQFGHPAVAVGTAIPEPTGAALGVFAAGFLAGSRRAAR